MSRRIVHLLLPVVKRVIDFVRVLIECFRHTSNSLCMVRRDADGVAGRFTAGSGDPSCRDRSGGGRLVGFDRTDREYKRHQGERPGAPGSTASVHSRRASSAERCRSPLVERPSTPSLAR